MNSIAGGFRIPGDFHSLTNQPPLLCICVKLISAERCSGMKTMQPTVLLHLECALLLTLFPQMLCEESSNDVVHFPRLREVRLKKESVPQPFPHMQVCIDAQAYEL